jgi:hypothetical protein
MKDISRREFLKYLGVGAMGLIARPSFAQLLNNFSFDASDVVQCFDEGATSGSTINEIVVQMMMNESIKALTSIQDVGEAWKSIFPEITENSVISIKINCINRYLATHPAVVNCIVNGLALMDFNGTLFKKNNIIIWDRTDYELTSSGYTIYTGNDPDSVRCFGTNHSGIGYDNTNPLNVNGVTSNPSRIISQLSDYVINAGVLRTHGTSVITHCMKNNYGSVHNPGSLHGGYCNPYIPSLNQQIRDVLTPNDKQKIFIIDGMFGLYSGGPGGSPNFNPKLLIMSKDTVACDYQGQNVINLERQQHSLQPVNAPHITTAAQPPYNLGTTDVNLIEINNPTGIKESKITIVGNENLAISPHPFRDKALITFTLAKPGPVRLDLINALGRVEANVYQGRLEAGRHQINYHNHKKLSQGTYYLRFNNQEKVSFKKVTVLN